MAVLHCTSAVQLKENAMRSIEKHGDPQQLGYVPTAHFNTEARWGVDLDLDLPVLQGPMDPTPYPLPSPIHRLPPVPLLLTPPPQAPPV